MDVNDALATLGRWTYRAEGDDEALNVVKERIAELERKNLQLAHSRLDAANLADNRGTALANVERLAAHIEHAPEPTPGYSARLARVLRQAATVPEAN